MHDVICPWLRCQTQPEITQIDIQFLLVYISMLFLALNWHALCHSGIILLRGCLIANHCEITARDPVLKRVNLDVITQTMQQLFSLDTRLFLLFSLLLVPMSLDPVLFSELFLGFKLGSSDLCDMRWDKRWSIKVSHHFKILREVFKRLVLFLLDVFHRFFEVFSQQDVCILVV